MEKEYIESYCDKCKQIGSHDIQFTIEGDDKTTLDCCMLCGEVEVDVDSVDEFDIIRDDGSEC